MGPLFFLSDNEENFTYINFIKLSVHNLPALQNDYIRDDMSETISFIIAEFKYVPSFTRFFIKAIFSSLIEGASFTICTYFLSVVVSIIVLLVL